MPRTLTPRRRAAAAASAPALAGHVLLCALCLTWALIGSAGCGRRPAAPTGDIAKLHVDRYRYNLDPKHHTARVLGEVSNSGTLPVAEAMVVATLRGPGGEERGVNRAIVRDIRPGQPRAFSMTITGHGKERDVDFRITDPRAPEAATAPENRN